MLPVAVVPAPSVIVASVIVVEKNNLSFIETSALDSSNVENAFQHILTGCIASHAQFTVYLEFFISFLPDFSFPTF